MTPKTKFTQHDIIEVAYQIAKDEGLSAITARKIANQLGCSVAPIYVNFKSIDELVDDVVKKVFTLTHHYTSQAKGTTPFEKIGYASFRFAKEHPTLFRELALTPNRFMSSYDQVEQSLLSSFDQDPQLNQLSMTTKKKLLLQMRIFQLGLSAMIANNHIPSWLTIQEAQELIIETGNMLLEATQREHQ